MAAAGLSVVIQDAVAPEADVARLNVRIVGDRSAAPLHDVAGIVVLKVRDDLTREVSVFYDCVGPSVRGQRAFRVPVLVVMLPGADQRRTNDSARRHREDRPATPHAAAGLLNFGDDHQLPVRPTPSTRDRCSESAPRYFASPMSKPVCCGMDQACDKQPPINEPFDPKACETPAKPDDP